LINHVPVRMRNQRRAGCTGDTQVIVSNQSLVELLVEIFEAIDSPAPLRVLRQLALSKLPVCDPEMTSIEDEVNDETRGINYDWIASSEAGPEQIALMKEQDRYARRMATEFLNRLSLVVRSNPQRTERLWRVLWHCFLDPDEPSQLEIAEMVGLSDSSVSDYRRKIETELRKLDFTPEQVSAFAEELDKQLQWRLSFNAGRTLVRPQPGQNNVRPTFSDEQNNIAHEFVSVAQAIRLQIESLPLSLCLESNPC